MGRRLLAGLGIVVGITGLLIDFWVIVGGMTTPSAGNPAHSLAYTVIYYFTFLTHIANTGLVLAYVSATAKTGWLGWFRAERTRAMLAGLIVLVGLFYHLLLAPTLHLQGPIVYANVLLHYVAPLLYVVWWAAYSPHGGLRWREIPSMLVAPLSYLIWVLLQGAVLHDYPYDIIDVDHLGYGPAIVNALVVFVELTILLLLVVGADHLLARRQGRSTT